MNFSVNFKKKNFTNFNINFEIHYYQDFNIEHKVNNYQIVFDYYNQKTIIDH